MKLTMFILPLTVVMFFWVLLATQSSHTFQATLFSLWLLSAFVCLGWGIYISRRSRLLGWLCVGVVLVQFIFVFLPVTSHVKIHTEIFEYETHVA
jgi:transcriptional regulator of nitric oxide reductase